MKKCNRCDIILNDSKDNNIDTRNILIDYKNFDLLNSEMKMRTLRQSIKDLTKAYYFPRSKKIINLVSRIKLDRGDKLHLSGCLIFKDKNNLVIKKS